MAGERKASSVDRMLGQRVRVRRLTLNMTQEHLAALLGLTFQQVQKYEQGVNRISASRLVDIAGALELPVADFYEGFAPPDRPQSAAACVDHIERALSTPEGVELMTLFASIDSAAVRRRLLKLVRAVVSNENGGG